MSRFIKLTRVITDLNENGKKKVTDAVKSTLSQEEISFEEEPRDDYNRTASYYEEMGIPVPEELKSNSRGGRKEVQVDFGEEDVKLDKGDWDENLFPVLVNLDFVETFEETEHYVLLGYTSGEEIYIKETIKEVEELIK